MRKSVGITEQEKMNEYLLEQMLKIETSLDVIWTADEKIHRALYSGGFPPAAGVRQVMSEFSLAQRELSIIFDTFFKELEKHYRM